jgi:hypothetical protein
VFIHLFEQARVREMMRAEELRDWVGRVFDKVSHCKVEMDACVYLERREGE